LGTGKPAVRQTENIEGFIFFSFYYTSIIMEVYQKLELQTQGTCSRHFPRCG